MQGFAKMHKVEKSVCKVLTKEDPRDAKTQRYTKKGLLTDYTEGTDRRIDESLPDKVVELRETLLKSERKNLFCSKRPGKK